MMLNNKQSFTLLTEDFNFKTISHNTRPDSYPWRLFMFYSRHSINTRMSGAQISGRYHTVTHKRVSVPFLRI